MRVVLYGDDQDLSYFVIYTGRACSQWTYVCVLGKSWLGSSLASFTAVVYWNTILCMQLFPTCVVLTNTKHLLSNCFVPLADLRRNNQGSSRHAGERRDVDLRGSRGCCSCVGQGDREPQPNARLGFRHVPHSGAGQGGEMWHRYKRNSSLPSIA